MGLEHSIFTSSPSPPQKKYHFGYTHNGKPIPNTYSHHCMMHRDAMLKFGTAGCLT